MMKTKNWIIRAKAGNLWTSGEKGSYALSSVSIQNPTATEAIVSLRIVSRNNTVLSTIITDYTVEPNESLVLDSNAINVCNDSRVEIRSSVAGVSALLSGVVIPEERVWDPAKNFPANNSLDKFKARLADSITPSHYDDRERITGYLPDTGCGMKIEYGDHRGPFVLGIYGDQPYVQTNFAMEFVLFGEEYRDTYRLVSGPKGADITLHHYTGELFVVKFRDDQGRTYTSTPIRCPLGVESWVEIGGWGSRHVFSAFNIRTDMETYTKYEYEIDVDDPSIPVTDGTDPLEFGNGITVSLDAIHTEGPGLALHQVTIGNEAATSRFDIYTVDDNRDYVWLGHWDSLVNCRIVLDENHTSDNWGERPPQ